MTKFAVKSVAVAAAAVLSMSASAAHAANATATARANILQQVQVTKTADLDFGTIVTGTAASTVQVSAAGARTCGAGLTCMGTTAAAAFSVTGANGQTVTLQSDPTVSMSNGAGGTMTASLAPSAPTMLLTSAVGGNNFTVGGTLNLGANQMEGAYTGTFQVTVNYQ